MSKSLLSSVLIVAIAAMGLASFTASAATIVVTPSDMQGWGFLQETATGSGSMVSGPGTPPIGSGSANLVVDGTGGVIIAKAAYAGLELADITALEYSTYRTSGSAALAIALQFNFDGDVTDVNDAFQGRVVYEPYHTQTVNTGAWETWDAMDDGAGTGTGNWWFSNGTHAANSGCSMATPCTWAEVLAAFPNGGVHNTLGAVILKAGGGWAGGFDGNVDALTVNSDTYDFELEDSESCSTLELLSSADTQFKGLTETDPLGSSADGSFLLGTPGNAVAADSDGFPGAWDAAETDPDVTGAIWVNNSATAPSNPAGVEDGQDGTVDTWRLFSHEFTLPAGAIVSSADLHFTSDNSVEAFLDNSSEGSHADFTTVADATLGLVTDGAHELEFVTKNFAFEGPQNPTGLLYRAVIEYCVPLVDPGSVSGFKFHDVNGNGVWDSEDGEPGLEGWTFNLAGPTPGSEVTGVGGAYIFTDLDAGDYTLSEVLQAGWTQTTPNPSFTLDEGEDMTDVNIGNACFVSTDGRSKGFWTNKNGQAQINDGGNSVPELALLAGLNLRNANGTAFDPASYAAYKTWNAGATATNMAYMLSAQLSAVVLAEEAGFVDGSAQIVLLDPELAGITDALGLITIDDLIDAADAALLADGLTLDGDVNRAYQEALKNGLEKVVNANAIQLCEPFEPPVVETLYSDGSISCAGADDLSDPDGSVTLTPVAGGVDYTINLVGAEPNRTYNVAISIEPTCASPDFAGSFVTDANGDGAYSDTYTVAPGTYTLLVNMGTDADGLSDPKHREIGTQEAVVTVE